MSKHLTVTQTAELLHDLRRTAREFVEREEKITREYRAKIDLAQKRLKQDLESVEADSANKITEAQAEYESAKTRAEGIHERRKTRIVKAYQTSNRQGLQWIEQQEGRKKYPIQKGLLDTKRNREEALKANDAKAASGAMAQHIRSGARYWSRALPYTPDQSSSSLRRKKGR